MKRRSVLKAGVAAAAASVTGASWLTSAAAETAGDPIRELVILTLPEAESPQQWQAAEIMQAAFQQLGLKVTLRPLPDQEQGQIVWYQRTRWDAAMWSMVGRPERSDPDELTYNLFVSANAKSGYDFVGYVNPAYDKIAEEQRSELDLKKRQQLIIQAQELINQDQPYGFLVYPINQFVFNKDIWDANSLVDQAGIGIRNFWTWINIAPKGSQRDIILNSVAPSATLNPFYIPGAEGSWITELVWDRLMRVGPDGMPKPWAAERVTRPTETTVELTLRSGMNWSDGQPVTVDDAVFSLTTPGVDDKSPMYKPFVANIANVEATGGNNVRITLKRPDAAFLTTTLSKLNLAPKHIWQPKLDSLQGKPQTLENIQEPKPVGSGPFSMVHFSLAEEVVLQANPDHWAKPKAARWIWRVMPNVAAALGALKSGELNFLSDYTGDPKVLNDLVKSMPSLEERKAVDIGFFFLAYNERRPPFNDVHFRQALSAAIDRNEIAADAWGGAGVPANSFISPALKFWNDEGVADRLPGHDVEGAKKILKDAGYVLVGERLHYPAGMKETTPVYS
jgi:peptide/nickel transport system substrate-binding protein